MRDRAQRRARAVFMLVLVVAAVVWLTLARHQWFIDDEWDFLAARDGGDLDDLFRPHNEHWSTLPILVYRGLWNLVGLRSYVPYLIPVVVAHLTVAALLRLVMLRSGVDAWIATAAASAFALFGPGQFNITYPFQIGFTGALALGLGALLVSDRDGPITRADAAGIALCVASLLCAGIAVVLVACVTLAVLLRRGFKVAAVYGGTTGAIFLLWATTAGRGEFQRASTNSDVAHFVERNLRLTLDALGPISGWSVAVGGVLIVGVPAALRAERGAWRRRAHLPLGLLAAAVAFALITGFGRGAFYLHPSVGAAASRYLHVTLALVLPVLALAASAIATRWRAWFVPMVLLFILGIPLNVRDAARTSDRAEAEYATVRDTILVTAHLPNAGALTRSLSPDSPRIDWVTVGWLADGAESGRIPRPGDAPSVDEADLLTELVLRATSDDAVMPGCRPLGRDRVSLTAGQRLLARGSILLDVEAVPPSLEGEVERFVLPDHALRVTTDGLRVGVLRGDVQLCPRTGTTDGSS